MVDERVPRAGSPERRLANQRFGRLTIGFIALLSLGLFLTLWSVSTALHPAADAPGRPMAGSSVAPVGSPVAPPAVADGSETASPSSEASATATGPAAPTEPAENHAGGDAPVPVAMSATDAAIAIAKANPPNPSNNDLPTQPSGLGPDRDSHGSITRAGADAFHGNGGLHRR